MYEAKDIVTSVDEFYREGRDPYESQTAKILDHIDEYCRVWIEHSTFLSMATVNNAGQVDVSPKGDPAGFVKVLDAKTLAIPDRPGNHRYDAFRNILETGRIGLVFLVPNRNEVVRVNGAAQVVRDMDVRAKLSVNDRIPDFAVIVRVEEAFYHCGKAIIRSKLWQPEDQLPTSALPTYAQALKAHGNLSRDLDELEKIMKYNDEKRLYDE